MDSKATGPNNSVAVLFAALWIGVFIYLMVGGWQRMVNEARADLVGVESVRHITKKLWPGALKLPPGKLLKLEEQIRDVLDNRPVPTFSREEREAIQNVHNR